MPTARWELVFVTATWSSVGRLMRPMLKKFCSRYRLRLCEVDIDREPGAVGKYRPGNLPSIILRDGDRELRRWAGYWSAYEMQCDLEGEFARGRPMPGLDKGGHTPL